MTRNQVGRIGFRILTGLPRPAPDLVARFGGLATPNIADALGRFQFMDGGIVARTGLGLCGVAVTVKTRPGDNLMVHKALEVAQRGDVVVVNTGGNMANAVFGELMGHSAVAAGLGGIVADGAIRDIRGITELGFPAFSRAVSPGACDKDGPGEINVPIACGNVVVVPGDIVVGDDGGVVVVPRADAPDVADSIADIVSREEHRVREILGGTVFKAEIDETLRRRGVLE